MSNTEIYTQKITVDGNDAVDTMFSDEDDVIAGRKFFITSFQGNGNLEISDDEENWIDTEKNENDILELRDTLRRYIRINAAGEKIIHLISL